MGENLENRITKIACAYTWNVSESYIKGHMCSLSFWIQHADSVIKLYGYRRSK